MKENKYLLPLYNRLDVAFIKGKKAILYDEKNKDYVDFASGVGVNSLGYANKKIVKTIKKQAKNILHSSNIYHIKPQEKCAKKIVELSTYDMQCFFCNSGAEANESAIKLARKYGNISFDKSKYKIITIKKYYRFNSTIILSTKSKKTILAFTFRSICFSANSNSCIISSTLRSLINGENFCEKSISYETK